MTCMPFICLYIKHNLVANGHGTYCEELECITMKFPVRKMMDKQSVLVFKTVHTCKLTGWDLSSSPHD